MLIDTKMTKENKCCDFELQKDGYYRCKLCGFRSKNIVTRKCSYYLSVVAMELSRSIASAVKSGFRFVDDLTYEKRVTTCKSCDNFSATKMRCKACGCFAMSKAKLVAWKCKEGKWDFDKTNIDVQSSTKGDE